MKYLDRFVTFEKNQSIIHAKQINDILQYIESGCFGILSAYHKDNTIPENEKHTRKLKRILKKANYQPLRIIGQWSTESNEISYVVQKPDNMSCAEFEDSLKEIAQDFDQDAFVFSRNGDVILINKDGSIKDIPDDFQIKDTFFGFTFK